MTRTHDTNIDPKLFADMPANSDRHDSDPFINIVRDPDSSRAVIALNSSAIDILEMWLDSIDLQDLRNDSGMPKEDAAEISDLVGDLYSKIRKTLRGY